jgi:hypothetical protein
MQTTRGVPAKFIYFEDAPGENLLGKAVVHQPLMLCAALSHLMTSELRAFHLSPGQALSPRYYNGRIAYQHKNLRIGLTTQATTLPHGGYH